MAWTDFITAAIKPVTKLIDELHTSDHEEAEIQVKLKALQLEFSKLTNTITTKVLEYEGKILKARSDIIIAEASGGSWIKQSWRPITMLTFLLLIVLDSFGMLAQPLNPQAWELLKLGLGGYVLGRSAEKIVEVYKK